MMILTTVTRWVLGLATLMLQRPRSKAVDVLALLKALPLIPAHSKLGESERSSWLDRKREQEVSHLHHTPEPKPGAQGRSDAGSRLSGQLTSLTHLLKVILALVGCRPVCFCPQPQWVEWTLQAGFSALKLALCSGKQNTVSDFFTKYIIEICQKALLPGQWLLKWRSHYHEPTDKALKSLIICLSNLLMETSTPQSLSVDAPKLLLYSTLPKELHFMFWNGNMDLSKVIIWVWETQLPWQSYVFQMIKNLGPREWGWKEALGLCP